MLRLCLVILLPVVILSAPPPPAGRSPAGGDTAMAAVVIAPSPPDSLADTRDSGRAWATVTDPPDAEACLGHGPAFAFGCRDYIDARDRARDAQMAANFR